MSAMELIEIILSIGDGKDAGPLLARANDIISENGGIPEIDRAIWVNVSFFCLSGGLSEIGKQILSDLVKNNIHKERMEKALQLANDGDFIKSAYIARGAALYNDALNDNGTHTIPKIVIDELPFYTESAVALDVGCGTGLFGIVARSSGYKGKLIGLDLVDEMVQAIPTQTYDDVVIADAFDWLERTSDQFDIITSLGLFVHFPVEKSKSMICLFEKAMRPGGVLLFDFSEKKERFVNSADRKSMMNLIMGAGLEIDAIFESKDRVSFVCRK